MAKKQKAPESPGKGWTKKADKKKPSLEQMRGLYELMGKIKLLKPWDNLWDMDLVCVELPKWEEPVFCSVMGRNGNCFGIVVHPGLNSAAGLIRQASSGEENALSFLGYSNCLTCYFGDREDLETEDRKLIKDLGLSFRGKNNWPYFRRSRPECLPWFISALDAEVLEKVLVSFIAAYTAFAEGKVSVDFEEGQVLYHAYSAEKNEWTTEARPLPKVPLYVEVYVIDNEIFTGSLRQKNLNGCSIEVDTLYYPMPCGMNKDGFPAVMRLALVVDSTQGLVADQCLLQPDDDVSEVLIELLASYINKFGRPSQLHVRDQWTGALLEDFCQKTGIGLQTGGVPLLDKFAEELNEMGLFG